MKTVSRKKKKKKLEQSYYKEFFSRKKVQGKILHIIKTYFITSFKRYKNTLPSKRYTKKEIRRSGQLAKNI